MLGWALDLPGFAFDCHYFLDAQNLDKVLKWYKPQFPHVYNRNKVNDDDDNDNDSSPYFKDFIEKTNQDDPWKALSILYLTLIRESPRLIYSIFSEIFAPINDLLFEHKDLSYNWFWNIDPQPAATCPGNQQPVVI